MLFAKYRDINTIINKLHACFNVNPKELKKYTLPVISIMDGEYQTNSLNELFGEVAIEDLDLPCYCVSYDLTHHTQYVHKQGLIWQAVRASMAYPALLPPMIINGDMHIDGGITNNLPTDVMDKLFMWSGNITAVDLG